VQVTHQLRVAHLAVSAEREAGETGLRYRALDIAQGGFGRNRRQPGYRDEHVVDAALHC
jgi:hypothetical protein